MKVFLELRRSCYTCTYRVNKNMADMIRMMKAVTETTAIAMIPPFERPELESTIQEKRKHFKKSVLYHLTTWKWLPNDSSDLCYTHKLCIGWTPVTLAWPFLGNLSMWHSHLQEYVSNTCSLIVAIMLTKVKFALNNQ